MHAHPQRLNSVWCSEATHAFTGQSPDWGFTQFLLLTNAMNAESGFIVDDTFILEVKISVQPKGGLSGFGRGRTGFVGLTNIPETCHANSILQFLYHIPLFRKASLSLQGERVHSSPLLGDVSAVDEIDRSIPENGPSVTSEALL